MSVDKIYIKTIPHATSHSLNFRSRDMVMNSIAFRNPIIGAELRRLAFLSEHFSTNLDTNYIDSSK